MQRRRIGVLVAVVALTAALTTIPGAATTTGLQPDQRGEDCQDFGLFIVAVPGAGETGKRGGTAGALARRVLWGTGYNNITVDVLRWAPRAPTVNGVRAVRRDGVRAPYYDGWKRAAKAAADRVNDRVLHCFEGVVLVGYSQGATVVRRALALMKQNEETRPLENLAGAVLIGDPTAQGSEGAERFGAQDNHGIVGRVGKLPRMLERGRTLVSWCHTRDTLCHDTRANRSHLARGVRSHQRYDGPKRSSARDRVTTYLEGRLGLFHGLPRTESFVAHPGEETTLRMTPIPGLNPEYGVRSEDIPAGLVFEDNTFSGVPSEQTHTLGEMWAWHPHIAPIMRFAITVEFKIYKREVGRPGARLVSHGPAGESANNDVRLGQISGDGQFVVFDSRASNLAPDDTDGHFDVFLWERATDQVTLVSRGLDGSPGNGNSGSPKVSADGRFVVFNSFASDLVEGDDDNYNAGDVFLWDRSTGTVSQISAPAGAPDPRGSWISADGSEVYFRAGELMRWDRVSGTASEVLPPIAGTTWLRTWVGRAWIASSDGRYGLLGTGPGADGNSEVIVWDTETGSEAGRCRLDIEGQSGDGVVSDDGRWLLGSFVEDRGDGITDHFGGLCDTSTGEFEPVDTGSSDGRQAFWMTPDADLLVKRTNDEVEAVDRSSNTTTSATSEPPCWCGPDYMDGTGIKSVSFDGLSVVYEGNSPNIIEGVDGGIFLWDREVSP